MVADEDDDANVATKPEAKPVVKTDTKPPERPIPADGEPTKKSEGITLAQTKKIYASVNEKSITSEQAKAYLKKVFHKMSTKELTISEASRLIEDINAGKLNSGGESALVKAAKAMGAVEVRED